MRQIIKRVLAVALICMMCITSAPFLSGNYAIAKSPLKPGKISAITVKTKTTKAKISWNKAKNAKKYQVKVMLGKKKIKQITTKKRSVTIKKLKNKKTYTVYVRGISGSKKGKWKKKKFKVGGTGNTPSLPQVTNNKPTDPTVPNNSDNDELPESRITIGDIEDLKTSGAVDAGYNDYGAVEYIYGNFTDKKVTNEDSAQELMDEASALVGNSFNSYNCDVQTNSTDLNSKIYRFTPTYEGLPIVGSDVLLESANNGTVEGMYNTYDSRIAGIDTWEEIDYEEAEAIAASDLISKEDGIKTYLNITDSDDQYDILDKLCDEFDINSKMVIYCTGSEIAPFLAYEVRISRNVYDNEDFEAEDGEIASDDIIPAASDDENTAVESENLPVTYLNYTYYIHANGEDCGEIYFVDDGRREALFWKNAEINATDDKNNTRRIVVQKKDNEYRLVDKRRGVYTYKAKVVRNRPDIQFLPGDIEQGSSLRKGAVSAHANMELVYDFYKKIGRNSYDGKGSKIIVTYAFANDEPTGWNNAAWTGRQMVFGSKGNLQNALDVAGHEFTHAVIDRTAGLIYEGESGALNESYADILGQLAEGKGGEDGWLMGEDSDKAVRSMKNPDNYGQPTHYYDYVIKPLDDSNDHGGVHTNSGIFNHAVYIMMTSQNTKNVDRYRWGKLFLNALDRMASKTKFLGARYAIVSTAKKMGFSSREIAAINTAFDDVGIIAPQRLRISMTWGAEPEDIDLHIVGPETSGGDRFHVYYEDLQYKDSNGNLATDLDHDDIDSYGPEVATIRKLTKGDYYVFVHDYTNGDVSGSRALSASGATIRIYESDSNTPERTFAIPTGNIGTYWNVCKITIDDDGTHQISTVNSFSENQVLF